MRGRVGPPHIINQNIPNIHKTAPIRAPELHKVPGRIQGLQIERGYNQEYIPGGYRGNQYIANIRD